MRSIRTRSVSRSVRPSIWWARIVLLLIMCLLGDRYAGAMSSGVKGDGQRDRIAITVREWVSTRAREELVVEIDYRLAHTPDRLGVFARHFEDPKELSELVASTYLHHAYVQPELEIVESTWNGKLIHLESRGDRFLSYPKGQGHLHLRARVVIPRGTWPLGCVRGQCAVLGALAPLPMVWNAERDEAWPMAARYRVRWEASRKPPGLVIHDSGQDEETLVVSPGIVWGVTSSARPPTAFFHRGVKVQIDGARIPAHRSLANPSVWPWPRNQRENLVRLVKEAIDTAAVLGVPWRKGQGFAVVVGPLRAQMVQSYSGLVVVSDRYLDTLPRPRFSKFHDASVVRGMLDALMLSSLVGSLESRDIAWVPGALGASMMETWRERRRLRDEDMAQILSPLGFIPGVDDVLYSGQATQAGSFFRSADEEMPLRRHPFYFGNRSPTGYRIYNKLGAQLGPTGFEQWRGLLLSRSRTQTPLRPKRLAAKLAKDSLDGFFDQWLDMYPEVDYALGEISSSSVQGGYLHRVEVKRASEVHIHEPVRVRVTDTQGHHVDRVWKPRGKGELSAWLEVRTPAKLKTVQIDPEQRLKETAKFPTRAFEREAHGDPRFNNQHPGKLRFVYSGVYFNLAFAELLRAQTRKARMRTFSGYLGWEAGLKRDLRRMFFFSLSKGRVSWLAGSAGVGLQFGPKLTGNRRLYALRLTGGVDWLTDAGFDAVGGLGTQVGLSLTRDTRRFARSPEQGHRVRISVVRGNDWLGPERTHRSDWTAGLSVAKYFRLAHNQVLALQGRLYGSFGLSSPMFRGLVRAGGIGGLSGFGADELLGRGVAMLKAEYRHIFFDSLRLNMLGLAWIRDIGGVAFTGAAMISDCEGLRGSGKSENYAGQVGYALTARYDILGIAPQLLRIGLALPIGRSERQCFGRAFPGELAKRQGLDPARAPELLAPFAVNLSFAHDF